MNNIFLNPAISFYCQGKNDVTSELNTLPTIWLEQNHTANFVEVSRSAHTTILNTDGVLTKLPNVHLKVKHADCLPVLLYHPLPIVGAIHAGRKGTEQKILLKILRYLKDRHGITDGLQLWFGPAICHQCYQVDRATNTHYDLITENTVQVRSIFPEDQAVIYYSDRCTAHENEHFFSYRKEGKGAKRNWSGIAIVSNDK